MNETKKKPFPIDILTTFRAFMQLWWFTVLIVFIGVFVAILAALSFSKETYRCRAVYLYSPKHISEETTFGSLTLETHVSLIKLPSNLDIMARRLDISPKSMPQTFDVFAGKKEGLITFAVEADSASRAYDMTKVITDVFIESQIEKRRTHAQEFIVAFDGQYKKALKNLTAAQVDMQNFIKTNKIVDISKEKQWYLEQLVGIEMELQRAQIDLSATDIKLDKMQFILKDLEEKAKNEKASQGQKESLTDMTLRKERLRQLISEAKSQQVLTTELRAAKENLKRLQKMQTQNIVSKEQIAQAKALIQTILVKLKDTDQIKKWKREIKKLDNFIVPKDEKETSSSIILKDILLQTFNLQLQQVAAKDRVTKIENSIMKNKKHLDKLAYLQEEYNNLERSIEVSASVVKQYQAMIESAELVSKLKNPDFILVSPPKLPTKRSKSNKKIIAILVLAVFIMIAFGVPVIAALLSLSCRSAGDARARLGIDIIGEFRDHSKRKYPGFLTRIQRRFWQLFGMKVYEQKYIPDYLQDANEFYTMATKISAHITGEKGWTIALCETHHQSIDHLCRVGHGLAYYLNKMGYNVLVVDMASLSQEDGYAFRKVCDPQGISYSYRPVHEGQLIRERPFRDFLEKAKESYEIILLLAPTTDNTASFRLCARYSEGSILLLEAGLYPFWDYFKTKKILEEEKSAILGMSVSNIQKPF